MPNYIIRTSNARPLGGDLSDVQIGFDVEVIDASTGDVLHRDVIQMSSLGLNQDPAEAERVSQAAADQWAKDNAEQIVEGERQRNEKAVERATAKALLDAIDATPDQVRTEKDLGIDKVKADKDKAKADALPVDVGGGRGR